MPSGCSLKAIRIDAAGYQKSIIQYCHAKGRDFAIRAPISPTIKQWISARKEPDGETILDDKGQPTLPSACCTGHCIGDHQEPFRLIIQRHPKSHQAELALDQQEAGTNESYTVNGYIYRAIATTWEGGRAQDIIESNLHIHLEFQRNPQQFRMQRPTLFDIARFGAIWPVLADFSIPRRTK